MISDLNKGIAAGGIAYNHLNMPTKIMVSSGSNTGVLDYVYSADGVKLRKINSNGTTTDYAGAFVYENGTLKQFDHAEGYVEPDGQGGYDYVYRYVDIWGNTRITYADDNGNGSIDGASEIRREQNYYPFGLEHKGYNSASYGVENNLKTYQAQEFTKDLDLNVHEWRYRIGDAAIGRFWQVDPLAEDYVYNSTYAFQENKLGMGVELEGLEFVGWELLQAASMDAAQNPNGVGAHTLGVGQGLANTVTGVANAVMDPVGTAKGLGNTAIWAVAGSQFSPAIDGALGTNATATGDALMNSLVAGGEKLANGNGMERGTVIGEMAGAILGTKGTTAAIKGVSNTIKSVSLTNPVPKTLARVVPGELNPKTLGAPGASDVFVTAASDIKGLSATQIANKLTIPQSSSGFKVIEFKTPQTGLSSPINRTNPGFVGKGRTAGGAREFTLPNLKISTLEGVKLDTRF